MFNTNIYESYSITESTIRDFIRGMHLNTYNFDIRRVSDVCYEVTDDRNNTMDVMCFWFSPDVIETKINGLNSLKYYKKGKDWLVYPIK